MSDEQTDSVKDWVVALLSQLQSAHQIAATSVEERLETQERQMALLTSGYVELVGLVQTLVTVFLSDDTVKREEFLAIHKQSTHQMIDALRHATSDMERSDPTFTARTEAAPRES